MLDENKNLENSALITLERLGFPMHEDGTAFYKDVIIDASKNVSDILSGESEDNFFSLVKNLDETNSPFYEEVANKKSIEPIIFQQKINNSLSKIDKNKTDMELFKEIFCTRPNSFGESVFYFALYLIGFSFKSEKDESLKLEVV